MTYPTTLTKHPVHGWQAVTEVALHDTEKGTRILRLRTAKAKRGIAYVGRRPMYMCAVLSRGESPERTLLTLPLSRSIKVTSRFPLQ
jgi:hypothetical protein